MFSMIELKLKKFKELRESVVSTICAKEEAIEARLTAIKSYPKNADRIKLVEGENASIELKKQEIKKEEGHVENLNRLIEKYEKLAKGDK